MAMTKEQLLKSIERAELALGKTDREGAKALLQKQLDQMKSDLAALEKETVKKEEKIEQKEQEAKEDFDSDIAKFEALLKRNPGAKIREVFEKRLKEAKRKKAEMEAEAKVDKAEAKQELKEVKEAVKDIEKAVATGSTEPIKKPKIEEKKRADNSKKRIKTMQQTITSLSALVNKVKTLKDKYVNIGAGGAGSGGTTVDLKRDAGRPAKPFGYRFTGKGKNAYRVPTDAQIKLGKKRGTIDYEARPNRSDVYPKGYRGNVKEKLADGGKTGKFVDGEYYQMLIDGYLKINDLEGVRLDAEKRIKIANEIAKEYGWDNKKRIDLIKYLDFYYYADGGMMAKGGETGQITTAKYYWNKFDKQKRVDFLVSAGYSKSVANDLSSESWSSLEEGVHKKLRAVLMADGGMMAKGGDISEQKYQYYILENKNGKVDFVVKRNVATIDEIVKNAKKYNINIFASNFGTWESKRGAESGHYTMEIVNEDGSDFETDKEYNKISRVLGVVKNVRYAKGGETGQITTAKYYWNKFDKQKRVDFLVGAGYSKSVANDLSSESWNSLEKGVHDDLKWLTTTSYGKTALEKISLGKISGNSRVEMADGGMMAKGGGTGSYKKHKVGDKVEKWAFDGKTEMWEIVGFEDNGETYILKKGKETSYTPKKYVANLSGEFPLMAKTARQPRVIHTQFEEEEFEFAKGGKTETYTYEIKGRDGKVFEKATVSGDYHNVDDIKDMIQDKAQKYLSKDATKYKTGVRYSLFRSNGDLKANGTIRKKMADGGSTRKESHSDQVIDMMNRDREARMSQQSLDILNRLKSKNTVKDAIKEIKSRKKIDYNEEALTGEIAGERRAETGYADGGSVRKKEFQKIMKATTDPNSKEYKREMELEQLAIRSTQAPPKPKRSMADGGMTDSKKEEWVKALYEEANDVFNAHINNGGDMEYSEKEYGYLQDELENVEVGYFKDDSVDSDYAEELREQGFTMNLQEAIDTLEHRLDSIDEDRFSKFKENWVAKNKMAKGGFASKAQANLDKNKNGRLDKEDFQIIRGEKKKKMAKGGKTRKNSPHRFCWTKDAVKDGIIKPADINKTPSRYQRKNYAAYIMEK